MMSRPVMMVSTLDGSVASGGATADWSGRHGSRNASNAPFVPRQCRQNRRRDGFRHWYASAASSMNRAKRSAPWSRRRASAAAFSARALDRAARSRQVADFDGPERAPVPVIVFSAKEAPETIADRVSAALVKAHTSGEQLAETARGYILVGARGRNP